MRRWSRIAVAAALAAVVSLVAACGGTGGGDGGDDRKVVLYTADGLADWYGKRFAEFRDRTGISVQVVEAGSGEVVSRLEKERGNPQADVVVTLPPFVQRAAQQDLLAEYRAPGTEHVPARDPSGRYAPLINNYLGFIYNPELANPAPRTWDDLLDPRFQKKIQYSTPGQAGDGTAVLLQLQHVLGEQGALDYLARLEANNVGPSSSTGKLQPKVAKGEILVANGDVQMNLATITRDRSNFRIFFPSDASGRRSTFALPYVAGLARNAPHGDNARKLLDFLFSAEAQKTVPEAYGRPARTDVTADGEIARQLDDVLRDVEIWEPDWDRVLARLDADLAAYAKAVGR
ncbi:2-aminoethylphosphonate transport system substrate-binding protein [Streptoalloteichus tenebrarius]|uniref:2-aminoethylphosphonate transport system substrate-binding protein n=1 Tax=Streptoalloteichus tenebrarius (strain ATCC 17920 / DSM 40477 / JCM 4838 / CBS 697.72 / NBRC 16177 / NCIMB 11028 / NRRL B-12390 / A12253. 1 / ISP 5477) TaxID=1933 RepID=A0ABT1HMT4_STRSD|nr:2-aminoethylphosphonate ABC transporter substrate-binding protein [Streptoalloteichus tenebrarius]MCP2256818.1 2-aminoethylphosphonate transport system substrate-binding protein [Streptoalloteichus tenebrarius]BFF00274.1 2-aminoethylphosphonate ABC transporter substrate-binding protein [Streptoalloteichus tenebrarius]